MSALDLLFIFAVIVSAVTLVIAAAFVITGQLTRALGILRIYGICAAAYLAISIGVAFVIPQRIISVGDPWCFDDWCLTVERVNHREAASQVSYDVELRIVSRARRITQRAKSAWICLIDNQGHRYYPDPISSAVPLDAPLEPLQYFTTSCVFHVPLGSHALGLVTGHGGPYCGPMDILVIGSGGCLFHNPTMVRIQ